jgi:leucyl aminopeptidase
MTPRPSISFARHSVPKKGSAVVLSAEGGGLGKIAKEYDPGNALGRAFAVADFSGKLASTVEVIAPQGSSLDRLVAVGAGKPANLKEYDWLKIGGSIAAQFRKAADVAVVLDLPDAAVTAADAAGLATGILLRAYNFDKYKTKKEDGDGKPVEQKPSKFTIQCADPAAAKKAFADAEAVTGGVMLARDLVNEPANKLGPVEFAAETKALEKLGVGVEILTEKEMGKLGMGALLGVAQGSPRGARLVVMQWNGGKAKDKPIAFVGKGVTFDTGGNSMKPAAGMGT